MSINLLQCQQSERQSRRLCLKTRNHHKVCVPPHGATTCQSHCVQDSACMALAPCPHHHNGHSPCASKCGCTPHHSYAHTMPCPLALSHSVPAHHSHRTGCDFVFIDLERCAIDHTTLSWMCQTYGAMGVAPVVRIAAAESKEARQCKASIVDAHTPYCTHSHTSTRLHLLCVATTNQA